MKGVFGRYLDVDLTRGTLSDYPVPDSWYSAYLGGRGVATRILLQETRGGEDPLGEGNVLVFATGPFQGLSIPGGGRHVVVARSPKTGTVNESYAGGFFAHELGTSGYDGIIVRGKANRPAYLTLIDGKGEIRDASSLWGTTVGDVEEALLKRYKGAKVSSIGPAGERLVRFACIVNDRNRAAGRPGFGAVMGSKNLKAVVVRGKQQKEVHDEGRLACLRAEFSRALANDPGVQQLGRKGTAQYTLGTNELGILPTRNFAQAVFDKCEGLDTPEYDRIRVSRDNCTACPVRCKQAVSTEFDGTAVDPKYGGPEYETVAAFGSLCLNDNLPSVALANQKCNELGLDTISTGLILAYVMEATERGLIAPDRGLAWGDAKGMVRMIDRIVSREGLGDLLAEGLKAVSEKLGGTDYAMQIKGVELPLHEPRGKKGLAISYATSPRGATHLEAMHDEMLEGAPAGVPELALAGPVNRFDWERKASLCKRCEDLYSFVNSLVICGFVSWNQVANPRLNPFPAIREMVAAATGHEMDLDEMMRIGERNYVLRRVATARDGYSSGDDVVPRRLKDPLPAGPCAGERIDEAALAKALAEYYRLRGFDDRGPSRLKLEELGLREFC